MKEVTVLKEFRDIEDFSKIYKAGSVVSLKDERAEELISRGVVKGQGEDPNPPTPPTDPLDLSTFDISKSENELKQFVDQATDIEMVRGWLELENTKGDKARKGVVKLLTDKISLLDTPPTE